MRVIKVESCKDCPYDYRGDCEAFDWDQREPIPESCPLPKWPSATLCEIADIQDEIFNYEIGSVEGHKELIAWLKSIGVEVSDAD